MSIGYDLIAMDRERWRLEREDKDAETRRIQAEALRSLAESLAAFVATLTPKGDNNG